MTSGQDVIFGGDFEGIFAQKSDGKVVNLFTFSKIQWKYLKITNLTKIEGYQINELKAGDYCFAEIIKPRKRGFRGFIQRKKHTADIFIPKTSTLAYSGNLINVVFRDFEKDQTGFIKLFRVSTNDNGLWLCRGKIYFTIQQPVTKPVVKVTTPPSSPTMTKETFVSGGDSNGTNHSGSGNLGDLYKLSSSKPLFLWTWLTKLFKLLLYLIIFTVFLGTLGYLYYSNQILFYILLFAGIIYGISRLTANKKRFNWLGWLILIFIVYYFYKNNNEIKNDLKETEKNEGSVKIKPPIKVDDNREGAINDFIVPKEISWWDFFKRRYSASFNTSSLNFRESNDDHNSLNTISNRTSSQKYYREIYDKMIKYDEYRVDSIYIVLRNKATEKGLTNTETAEMVTTFIQEIPYYLVHDQSCSESVRAAKQAGNDFIVEYHEDKKPCLSNVLAGVQSPYEFMHNLKGDCDTRALFGHAILSKLGIPSSVWISETYGHSILGVGVPVSSGSFKVIDGRKHYAVELTAKGFPLGMISPAHRNMKNWEITTYKN